MKYALLLLWIIAICSCAKKSENSLQGRSILIRSEGALEVLPDVATFRVELYCTDKSVGPAKNCLVQKSNQLTDKLIALGIAKNDILTTSVTMHRNYVWRNNSNVSDGFRSATSMIVTVKDIKLLEGIYSELLENRNLELGELNYSHSKLDSLQNEAYADALVKSGSLADKLLSKLPGSSKEIFRIANTEISAAMPERIQDKSFVSMESAHVAPQMLSVNGGTMHIRATLYVEYLIRQ